MSSPSASSLSSHLTVVAASSDPTTVASSSAPCYVVQYQRWLDANPKPMKPKLDDTEEIESIADWTERKQVYLNALRGNTDIAINDAAVASNRIADKAIQTRLIEYAAASAAAAIIIDEDKPEDSRKRQRLDESQPTAAASASSPSSSSSPPSFDAFVRLQNEHMALLARYANRNLELSALIERFDIASRQIRLMHRRSKSAFECVEAADAALNHCHRHLQIMASAESHIDEDYENLSLFN